MFYKSCAIMVYFAFMHKYFTVLLNIDTVVDCVQTAYALISEQ